MKKIGIEQQNMKKEKNINKMYMKKVFKIYEK